MNIIVFLRMVPDVVEELKISANGKALDENWLRFKLSESDEHSLEQAIIMKERYGGRVTVAGLESPELDDSLYYSLTKGADSAVRIAGEWNEYRSPAIAEVFAGFLKSKGLVNSDTVILSGSQAIDDLEGEMIFYLSDILDVPCQSVITAVNIDSTQNSVKVMKEFAGGLRGEYELKLPAVLGIQAAENPPRYIPIAKIRNIMKTSVIEEFDFTDDNLTKGIVVERLMEPESSGMAEMLEGSPEAVCTKIVDILHEHGLI